MSIFAVCPDEMRLACVSAVELAGLPGRVAIVERAGLLYIWEALQMASKSCGSRSKG